MDLAGYIVQQLGKSQAYASLIGNLANAPIRIRTGLDEKDNAPPENGHTTVGYVAFSTCVVRVFKTHVDFDVDRPVRR